MKKPAENNASDSGNKTGRVPGQSENLLQQPRSPEEEIDEEWDAQKRVLDHYLNPKEEHPHHVHTRNQLESELDGLKKLKYYR